MAGRPISIYDFTTSEVTLKRRRYNKGGDETGDYDTLASGTTSIKFKCTDNQQGDGKMPLWWLHGTMKSTFPVHSGFYERTTEDFYTENARNHMPVSNLILSGLSDATTINLNVSANRLNRLHTECLAKLGDGKINIGIATAEVRKTASSLAKVAGEGIRFLRAIKTANVKGLKRYIKNLDESKVQKKLADRWLEYNYAFKPLAADIAAAVDIHNNGIIDNNLNSKSIQATRGTQYDLRTLTGVGTTARLEENATIRMQVKIRASINNAEINAMKVLGLTNPNLIRWELVPFSFVLDWLVPVGTFLQALNAPMGITFESGYTSIKGVSRGNLAWDTVESCGGSGCTEHAVVDFESSCFERRPMNDFPTPKLYTKNPFSTSHALTSLALLNNTIRYR